MKYQRIVIINKDLDFYYLHKFFKNILIFNGFFNINDFNDNLFYLYYDVFN